MLGTADLLTENQVAEQLANITDGLPDEAPPDPRVTPC